jgi:hypothetical protein
MSSGGAAGDGTELHRPESDDKRSGKLIHDLLFQISERASAQVVNDPTAKFVNW